MAKTYNLYFGKGKDQVKYYTPSTPEKELQNLIDNPDAWKQYLKNHKEALELVENERDALENERDNLETERDQLKKDKADFEKFLKDNLGYNTIADAITALGGHKLPDILTDADNTIKTLKNNNDKLKEDITNLNTQILGMVDEDELIKAVDEKNNAITQLGNLGTAHTKLQGEVNAINTKWEATDLNNLSVRIQATVNERNKYKNERDTERQKIADAKTSFNNIVDKINKRKTVIIGDLNKTKIRQDLNRIKGALGYADINADIDSGEE